MVFSLGKKRFLADFDNVNQPVREIDTRSDKIFSQKRKAKTLLEGLDSAALDINSFNDFWVGKRPDGWSVLS